MKILHFYKTAIPESIGGIEVVIDTLARKHAQDGLDVKVLALSSHDYKDKLSINGYKLYRAKRNFEIASTGFSLSVFKKFAQLAKESDIIHYHFPWPFMDLVHLMKRPPGKPAVLTYHSDIIRQKHLLKLYRPLKRKFLNSVDRIVATSPNYLETSQVLSRFQGKTSVIPIGLEASLYKSLGLDRTQYWGERFAGKFFLFVGVLRYYKGLHILLDAMKYRDYPMIIVGAGPIEKELWDHAKRLRLTNVHFLGEISDADKCALLRLCYAVVFPSHLRSEAFGVSLLEGALFGKPLISSELGTGTSYINLDQDTGLVVPPNNSDAFRSAMDLLWENPKFAAKCGESAYRRFEQLFSADRMADSYCGLYQELLGVK